MNIVSAEEISIQNKFIDRLAQLNESFLRENGKRRVAYVHTFGCQMNENDSEKMAGMLLKAGYEISDQVDGADVVVFNTCCVRQNAENKFYGHIGALKKAKTENKDMIIVVCGCMVKQAHVVEHIKKTYKHVDILMGNANEYCLPEFIYTVMETHKYIYRSLEDDERIPEGIDSLRKFSVKAYVTAMYGCNNFCSYCVVPYVRGRERSRSPEAILNEVSSLAANSCKEVMILGQNVNSYGKNLDNPISFTQLLQQINNVEGIERIRFMTSHPKDISDELIGAFSEISKLEYHLHLPLQSGSSRVLKEMNRHYSADDYMRIIDKVKCKNPNIALTTDIIVGFPGETEDDFQKTLDMIEFARFDSSFSFIYSMRNGTIAAKRDDQIEEDVKNERFKRLLEVQNKISLENNQGLVGSVLKVLVEGQSREKKDAYTGRTSGNHLVSFTGCEEIVGSIQDVKITKAQTWSLEGEIVHGG